MENKITVSGLAAMIALATGRPGELCERFLEEFFSIVGDELAKGENVRIKGLGTFKIVEVEARKSVEVATGADIEIPAHKRVVFVAAKELAQRVNSPFEAFEAVEVSDALPTDELLGMTDEELLGMPADEAEVSDEEVVEEKPRNVISFTSVLSDSCNKEIRESSEVTTDERKETTSSAESFSDSFSPQIEEGDSDEDAELSGETITEEEDSQNFTDVESEAETVAQERPYEPEKADISFGHTGKVEANQPDISFGNTGNAESEQADISFGSDGHDEPEKADMACGGDAPDEPNEPEDSEDEGDDEEYEEAAEKGRFGRGFLWGFLTAIVVLAAVSFIAVKTNLFDGVLSGYKGNPEATVNPANEDSESLDDALTGDLKGEEDIVDSLQNDSTRRAADIADIGDEDAVPTPESDSPVYDTVSTTRYLTTMAQQHYGDYNFWPIIYKENQAFLGNPDRITPGTKVVIPPLSKYKVDPLNPEDVKKMKQEGVAIYAKFKKR